LKSKDLSEHMEQSGKNNFNTNETLLSARKAAQRLSCNPDYVSKLCREGKLEGVRQDGAWMVSFASIAKFEKMREEARIARAEELSKLRKAESKAFQAELFSEAKVALGEIASPAKGLFSFNRVGVVVGSMLFFAAFAFAGGSSSINGVFGAPDNTLSATVAKVDSPFFGNNPFAIFAALFTPKTAPVVATATSTDSLVNSGNAIAQNAAPSQNATSTKTTIVQNNTYPVIERTVEHTATVSGITSAEVDAKLAALDQSIRALLFATVNSIPNSLPSAGGVTNNIALSQRIDKLDNVTLTNVAVSGVSGLTDADIPDNITINTSSLNVTATSTLAGLTLSGVDCSANNNGGKLTTDAFGNIICGDDYGASGAGTPGGPNGTVQYNDGGSFGGTAGFAFNKASGVLTVPQILATGSTTLQNVTANSATTTNLFASSAQIQNVVLGSLTGPLQAVGGVVSSTSTLSVAFGGTGLSSSPFYGQVLVGNNAGGYTLTSTSSLGIASAAWGNITGSLSSQTDLQSALNGKLSTSSLDSLDKGYFFSTTSANYLIAQSALTGFSTTSAQYFLSQNQGLAFSTTSGNAFIIASSSIPHISGTSLGDVLYWTGSGWSVRATSTLGLGGSGGGSVTSVDASGGSTGLSFSGGPITTSGVLTLTGTLGVANGGTGSTTLTGLLKGSGTGGVLSAVPGIDYVASNAGDWTGTFDGQEGAYYLANSFATSSAP
jgi:hypothetical protein